MQAGMTGGRAVRMRALSAISGSTSQVSTDVCGMPTGQTDRRDDPITPTRPVNYTLNLRVTRVDHQRDLSYS